MNARIGSCLSAIGLMCFVPGVEAALCARDDVPAATLLLPWFEVSTDCAAVARRTTEFSVTNTSDSSRLTRVTLWSNAGVPVLGIDVFLNGFAQQTIDLRAMLCAGTLPVTGIGVSPVGRYAAPATNFASCNVSSSGGNAPVYNPLSEAQRNHLRAVLAGNPSPTSGLCAGLPSGLDGTAVGYVTVDLVFACNLPLHGQPAFYDGLLNDNVLVGSATLVDNVNNFSVALPLVGMEAASGAQLDLSNNFYGINQNQREPLPVAWQIDINYNDVPSAAVANDLLAWRAPESVGSPFACASPPSWHPLGMSDTSGFGSRGWFVVDDQGKAFQPGNRRPFPLIAQRISAAQAASEVERLEGGMVYANFSHELQMPGPFFLPQAWIGSISQTAGRYARMTEGVPVSAACDAAPFNNTPPVPRRSLNF